MDYRPDMPRNRLEREYVAWKLFATINSQAYLKNYGGLLSRIRGKMLWSRGLQLSRYAEWIIRETAK
jgi:hypothetical protein